MKIYSSSFQEDLGGSLFNLLDFFPSEDCSSILGGFVKAKIFDDKYVGNSRGTIQNAIASALTSGEKFYVNAKNEDDNQKYLLKYGESVNSNLELYHFVRPSSDENKCLTFSSDESGILESEAVNCNTKHRPLCLDFDREKLSDFSKKCQECVPNIEECKKWVKLEQYPIDGVTIEGAELCVQPCGEKTYEESSEFCQVGSFNNLKIFLARIKVTLLLHDYYQEKYKRKPQLSQASIVSVPGLVVGSLLNHL